LNDEGAIYNHHPEASIYILLIKYYIFPKKSVDRFIVLVTRSSCCTHNHCEYCKLSTVDARFCTQLVIQSPRCILRMLLYGDGNGNRQRIQKKKKNYVSYFFLHKYAGRNRMFVLHLRAHYPSCFFLNYCKSQIAEKLIRGQRAAARFWIFWIDCLTLAWDLHVSFSYIYIHI